MTPLDDSGSSEPEPEPERVRARARAGARGGAGAEAEAEPEPGEGGRRARGREKPRRRARSPPSRGGGGGGGDSTSVTLPALGESVTEGTVTRWLKSVGDDVAVDEPLLEVSTDKVDTEIPSPVAGKLLEIKVEEDETVEVGAELAVIGSGDAAAPAEKKSEDKEPEPEPEKEPEPEPEPKSRSPSPRRSPSRSPSPSREGARARAKEEPKEPEPEPAKPSSTDQGDGAGYVTPLVRKLASQNDVDLSAVKGTGVGGRIRKQDVLDAAKSKQAPAAAPQPTPASTAPAASSAPGVTPSPLRGTTEKISRLRKIIAERMVDSLQTGAQLTQVIEVDVTRVARLRDASKQDFLAREGVKLSYLPFFAKAAIDSLKQHPRLNAAIDTEAGEITYFDVEHIAFAVDTEKGLITPVVKDAGDLSIAGLAKKIADVAERTRTNKIGPDELSGGTFTITNLGSVGALWDTPIINKPQVAILGPGAVVKRPVVIDDPDLGETIAVRHMVYLALTYDHRLVDGADAGRFLQEIKKRLEAGQFEV